MKRNPISCWLLLALALLLFPLQGGTTAAAQEITQPPADLWPEVFQFEYTLAGSEDPSQPITGSLNIGIANGYSEPYKHIYSGELYIQGLCEQLPEAWAVATIADEITDYEIYAGSTEIYTHLKLSLPQYLGEDETAGPLYLTAFDTETGEPLSEVELEFRPYMNTIGNLSAPLCISTSITEKQSLREYTSMAMAFEAKVISDQPEGVLHIYNRSGKTVKEVGNGGAYTLTYGDQTGAIEIVFTPENKVYLHHPVSELPVYDGWVEGTLSADGKTITVGMGQFVAYTRSFNMAVQMWMCIYDEATNTFHPDRTMKEVTFSLDSDVIRMEGSSETCGLGYVNRSFGCVYSYLNGEWLQTCDYESVYTHVPDVLVELPDGVEPQEYYCQTIENSSWGMTAVRQTAHLAFDGDDVYLNGFNTILPDAWIKGHRDGDNLVFPSDQFIGSYISLVYFKNARISGGQPAACNLVLTYNGRDAWSSTDYLFISEERNSFVGLTYSFGLYLSEKPDELIAAPEEVEGIDYQARYESLASEEEGIVERTHLVSLRRDGDDVYIQGLWRMMPDAWVKGTLTDDKLTISTPQYLGEVEIEDVGDFPVYLTAFDTQDGSLLPEITFDYHANTGRFDNQSAGISIGVNKAVYMTVEDIFDMKLSPVAPSAIELPTTPPLSYSDRLYDLQGREIRNIGRSSDSQLKKGIYIYRGRKVSL